MNLSRQEISQTIIDYKNDADHAGLIGYASQVIPFVADPLCKSQVYQERLEEALKCFNRVMALENDFPGAHYHAGEVYFVQKKYKEAAACYEKYALEEAE